MSVPIRRVSIRLSPEDIASLKVCLFPNRRRVLWETNPRIRHEPCYVNVDDECDTYICTCDNCQ
jgi:hypothetical protein